MEAPLLGWLVGPAPGAVGGGRIGQKGKVNHGAVATEGPAQDRESYRWGGPLS
jgi:hypothetical protein